MDKPTTLEEALHCGASHYFPLQPCERGHTGYKRDVKTQRCNRCNSEASIRSRLKRLNAPAGDAQSPSPSVVPPPPRVTVRSTLAEQGFRYMATFDLDDKGLPTLSKVNARGLYCMVVDGQPVHVGLTAGGWSRRWGNYRGAYDSANARIRGWLIHCLRERKAVELWMREGEADHAAEIAARTALAATAWYRLESPAVADSFESAVARAVYGLKAASIRNHDPEELRARLQAVLDLLPEQ